MAWRPGCGTEHVWHRCGAACWSASEILLWRRRKDKSKEIIPSKGWFLFYPREKKYMTEHLKPIQRKAQEQKKISENNVERYRKKMVTLITTQHL